MDTLEAAETWQNLIQDVPDFPQQGIVFRDITPLLADGKALRAVVDAGISGLLVTGFVHERTVLIRALGESVLPRV